jgi:hypothetical protein
MINHGFSQMDEGQISMRTTAQNMWEEFAPAGNASIERIFSREGTDLAALGFGGDTFQTVKSGTGLHALPNASEDFTAKARQTINKLNTSTPAGTALT